MKTNANTNCWNMTAKRLLSLCLALAMLLTLFPAITLTADAVAAGETLYFKASNSWKSDNARFAAYFFGNGDAWASMTDDDGDGYYECSVPTGGYTYVIFCRMNPSAAANNWDNKWNQTADLTLPSGSNCFAIPEDAWDGTNGTWSTYTPATEETTGPTEDTTPVGEDDKVIIHFLNNLNWQAVCGFVWAENGDNDGSISGWSWPGQTLSKDSDGYYTLELDYAPASGYGLGMLFHNNGGVQTVDLTIDYATLAAAGQTEVWVQPSTTSDGKYTCNVVTDRSKLVISPEVDGTSVTFRYSGSASSVKVAGNMLASDWSKQTAMTKGSDGIWSCTMTVEPGVYQYKFIVDGSWINDPANPVTIGSDNNNVLTVADPDAVDNDQITVKLHYTRPDGNYTDWNVWMWTLSKGADQYDFADENGEKVATITLNGRENRALSFIVRKGKWVAQEGGERQVDLSTVVAGTVHCYVTSDVQAFSVVLGPDVIIDNKILNTSFDYDNNTISITTALPVSDPASEFDIAGVTIKSVSTDGCTYTITPSTTLSLDTLYQNVITFLGYEYDINYTSTVYASDKFADEFTYTGGDLGANWTSSSTTFKLWAPTATKVQVALYASGTAGTDDCIGTYTMTKGANGVWTYKKSGNLHGTYYTYLVTVDGETVEACDPYARTTGVNGNRAMVINMDSTDPAGWDKDTNPNPLTSYTDAIIYELHVRDFSIDDSSGVSEANRGKFLGLTEKGTTTPGGATTGLDYLAELGFTHLHLLPVYDYASVDETTCDSFNWGYDPQNYNVPEGSYSTDPYNGAVRVAEMKQMVKALHDNGISVIMDVVYNHVYDAGNFPFNMVVPYYFSRQNPDGSFSNGSGCGNDTASEREMVRDYIVSSVMYWKEEYHIDGFRFDLVGLLDAETINQIVNTVHAKYPDVIFYGEGWTMGTAVEGGVTSSGGTTIMATQANSAHTPEFAYFSDTIRNLLAGQNGNTLGFVSGLSGQEEAVANNFKARPGWTSNPYQIIQYASCHDNYTLVDKIILSTGRSGIDATVIKMNNLAAAVYMTSQGIPFIHAGEEFLREKLEEDGGRCENSYNASDYVNHIEWSNLDNATYAANSEYYKGLIEFRKNHAALRLTNATDITNNVTYTWVTNEVVKFQINGGVNNEIADSILVIFNANSGSKTVSLPSGTWSVCVDATRAGVEELYTASGSVSVPGISAMVLVKGDLAMECSHNYVGVVTEPTCTTGGYTTYTCSLCGDTYTGNETAASGHSWDEGAVTKEPTETETGIRTYTCTVCSTTKTETIEKLEHTHSYTAVVTEPTCTEGGYTTYTCAGCGDSYTADETAATGHSYVDGSCTVCGAADPDYVPPVPENGGYVKVTSVSDITAGGKFVIVALNNGTYNAMNTTLSSGKLNTTDVTVTGGVVTSENPPVWTVEAVSGGISLNVNGVYLGYSSGTNFTTSTTAYTWTVSAGSNGGFVINSAAASRGIYYQISGDRFGAYATSNATSSSYVSELQLYKYVSDVQEHEHSYTAVVTEPTCTEGGYTTYTCAGCGDSYTADETAATGHSYGGWVTTKDATCTEAGTKTSTCSGCGDTKTETIEAAGHSYADGSCTVCGAADPDATVTVSNVALAGSFNSWNTANYMAVAGTNTVTATLELSAGTYTFKIVENGAWMGNDGIIVDTTTATSAVGWEMVDGAGDCTLKASGGTYTFVYNTSTNMLVITYEGSGDIGGETGNPDDYYLFGYINGLAYGEGDDYANLGSYKFTDGKITVTFTADSYVGVKTGDNAHWYMTDGWMGSVKSATLYDTGVYTMDVCDKLMVPGGVEVTFSLTVNSNDTVTLSYEADTLFLEDESGIQDGVTLHAWNWSFANIEANMAKIAELGYTAIQTSPIQALKEGTVGKASGTNWWVYYQPVDFVITTDSGNALGTKAEFESMCQTAHEYGIKIIVDVVANHLANQTGNDLSTMIPAYLRDNTAYWHNYTTNTTDYTDRYDITQHCMSGLPDLNTGNDDIQGYVLDFLKECIDSGADGFRFDAAKHIETPEDATSFASDFWPTVIGGAEAYAKSTRNIDLYCYGELLDAPGGTLPISAYTEYIAVTDNSWGNSLRGNIVGGKAAVMTGYDKAVDAGQLILWAESHDTYANAEGGSTGISEADINKTWALVAARADAMGLYFARPSSLTTTLLGAADVTGWANDEVKAVNLFHNAFAGQGETVGNSGSISYVVRGTTGVVLVNASGTSTSVSNLAVGMTDGTYTEQITGNTFTVSGGKISGSIGSTGIAVVYNAVEEPELFDIPLASMTMGNSLAINFAFPKASAEDWTGAYAKITKTYSDDRDDVVVTVPYAEWKSTTISGVAHYYVTFNGIAAKEMADEVYVTIYGADGKALSNTKTDSVRDQSMRTLVKTGVTDKEKTMVVDMLNYGAAAQEYFAYGTEDLANNQLTAAQAAYASEPQACTDSRAGSGNFVASTVVLKSNIQMMFAFKNVDETHYAVVTFTNHRGAAKSITVQGSEFTANGSAKVVTVDALVVADGRQVVTCVVYDANGNEVARVTDSLESYTARNNGKDVLFTRMMQYSDSAYNYFH